MYDQIKNLIISGELSPGEPLPSIRGIAKDLKISVITTKRAYDELEKDGYIYSTVGRGSFVSPNVDKFEERKKNALREVEKSIGTAIECGAGRKEITEILDKALMNGGLL